METDLNFSKKKGITLAFFCCFFAYTLYNCKNLQERREQGLGPLGTGRVTFNKDSIILDSERNEVSFKSKPSREGMEISGVLIIIDNDTTFISNEKVPHENRYGDRKQFVQYFYYYRDTVYGDWYTAIHKGNKIYVKLDENTTGKRRKLMVFVEDGNPQGNVKIIQDARIQLIE